MIRKTEDLDQFVLRDDNRELRKVHLKHLKESIEERNRLEDFPILVNENMEVIDGQHRLTVAKMLEIPIYYKVSPGLQPDDMLRLNVNSRNWSHEDVMNHYAARGFKEYIKFKEFMEKHGLLFSQLMAVAVTNGNRTYQDFRRGKFTFPDHLYNYDFDIYTDTMSTVRMLKGCTTPFKSKRFIKSFFIFTAQEDFDKKRWLNNLSKLVSRFVPCVSAEDYEQMFSRIYNYHRRTKNKTYKHESGTISAYEVDDETNY